MVQNVLAQNKRFGTVPQLLFFCAELQAWPDRYCCIAQKDEEGNREEVALKI
jgi:hypothetical protein